MKRGPGFGWRTWTQRRRRRRQKATKGLTTSHIHAKRGWGEPRPPTPPSLSRSEGGPCAEGREVEMTPLEEKTQGGEGERRQSSLGEGEAEES